MTEQERQRALRAAFDGAMTRARGGTRRRPRHPATITADRLADHLDRWHESTDGNIRDAIGLVRDWLDRVSEGES